MAEPHPPAESAEARLRRLRIRSIRRGIREMDVILGRFADTGLPALTEDELVLYDALLSENDLDLFRWVSGQTPPPARFAALVGRIARLVNAAG
ncbi:MAG: succinate dehydrogenase assembly factor 2 [Roseovarius sp.]